LFIIQRLQNEAVEGYVVLLLTVSATAIQTGIKLDQQFSQSGSHYSYSRNFIGHQHLIWGTAGEF